MLNCREEKYANPVIVSIFLYGLKHGVYRQSRIRIFRFQAPISIRPCDRNSGMKNRVLRHVLIVSNTMQKAVYDDLRCRLTFAKKPKQPDVDYLGSRPDNLKRHSKSSTEDNG